ncbi:serum response factor isoform X3 [Labeo rohita]|uniref:Serum response factor isoform X3 n=1 Tax=Labeo rohita TaxID=84645 RepID=A0A498MPQ9_LABRO|nr:serum response factor isoform X3 [Labeo rohita]
MNRIRRSVTAVLCDALKPAFTVASVPGSTSAPPTVPSTSTSMQASSGPSFPITNYLAPAANASGNGANGTVLKSAGAAGGVMQLPGGFTFMSGVCGVRGQGSEVTCAVHNNIQIHLMSD